MKLALLALLPLVLLASADAAAQKPRATQPAAPPQTTLTVTTTDLTGTPLADVQVSLAGLLDRSGTTGSSGTLKFDGLRPGTYRLRFTRDEYVVLERELEVRAGQPPPNLSVSLTPAPAEAPPPAPEPAAAPIPPPGKAITVHVPDFIEKNFISNSQPQKTTDVGCSGLAQTVLWQVREPWENRSHATADALLYVVGGEGVIRMGTADVTVQAGSFAQIPRGTTFAVTRRGRNPIIILATLVGDPCGGGK